MVEKFTPLPLPISTTFWAGRLLRWEIRVIVVGLLLALLANGVRGSERFLLSEEGSGRATAYLESPKIITFEGKTHAAWLDTPPEGFRVRIRTRDHATGEWSATTTIGEATNNHGGPALTIDGEGYLHVLYFSHHHPFRYRKSLRPNDASAWTEYSEFGYNLTYPALVCAADGTLMMTARRSFDEKPWELEMWTKAPTGEWTRQQSILRSRYDDYAQFAASLSWGPDHKTLHLGARIYEVTGEDVMKPITTSGYLASDDGGATWRKANGEAVELPATSETFDAFAQGRASDDRVLHIGSLAVNADGEPHLVYGAKVGRSAQAYLVTPTAEGGWKHVHLNPFLPAEFREWDLFMYGGVSFGADGQLLIVGTLMEMREGSHEWGEITTEIVRFRSADGGQTFTADVLDVPNPDSPRWMPNIERPTGFNEIPDQPSFIYTDGVKGDALHDVLTNHIWWVPN